jgi:Ca2+-binding EF-hand superfamily protein
MSLLKGNFGFTDKEKQELHTAFKRFDTWKNGQISLDSIGKAFRWLGYHLDPQEVKSIADYCDKDGSEGIDLEEFMAAVAEAKQAQMKKVRELAQEQDRDHSGTLSMAELGSALKALGYVPDRRLIEEVKEALTSDPSFKNHLRQLDLRVEDLTDFLELYRTREGLTSDECSELRSAFVRYDSDGLGRIRSSDAEKVLRWYGLSLDSQACARFVATIDVDRSGYLSEYDFRKILRVEAEAAVLNFEEKFRKMDYSAAGTIACMQAESLYQELGLDLDPSSLRKDDLIVYTSFWQVSGDVPMDVFVSTCMKRKKFMMANWREYGNFSDAEIDGLKDQFDQYVEEPSDDEEDAPSEITVAAFFQFLDGMIPTPINAPGLEERFVELKKELESSKYPTLSFQDVLRMYRPFHEIKAELAQLKYAKAVQASGFSQTEIEEFRHLFEQHANEQSLEPSELRRLVGTVLPLSEQKNMAALTTALKEVQRNHHPSSGGGVDFSDFLLVMKKIEGLNPRKKTETQ